MPTRRWIRRAIAEEADRAGARVERVLLFGSRARSTHRADSDWDLCVVLDRDLAIDQRRSLASRIRWALARRDADCDVIVQTADGLARLGLNAASLAHRALQEGVEL